MSTSNGRRFQRRTATLAAIGLLVVGLAWALPQEGGAGQGAAAAVAQAAPAGRIAYAGTAHRSLGVVTIPPPGQPSQTETEPLFGPGPAHFDQDASARGDLLAFVSLRDEARPQVYLRAADGSVLRLTAGRNAGHPVISPDRQWVAFHSAEPDGNGGTQDDVWRVRADGSDLQRLTQTPGANETGPTWSPDGSQLAFASDSDRDRGWEIYRMPAAGGSAVRVTDEPTGAAVRPAWNPVDDASHRELIAYTCDGDGDLSGVEDQKVHIVDVGLGVAQPLFAGDRSVWQSREPSWTPDGNALLFVSRNVVRTAPGAPEDPDGVDKVYRVDTGNGLPTPADPQLLLAEDRALSFPAFLEDCPCGRLVVTRTSAPDQPSVTLQDIQPDGVDPRDLGVTILREDPGIAEDPRRLFAPRPGFDPWFVREAFSPDGRRIAVSRFEDSASGSRIERVWLVDADGGNPQPLPVADRGPADWETDPAWSPDGRLIAFARRSPGGLRPAGGRSRIVIVDVASGEVVARLVPPARLSDHDDTQPEWSPDGQTLAYTRGLIFDQGGVEVRNTHIGTARASDLSNQRDISAAVCGGECLVADDSSAFSPDGRQLALNREPDGLLLASADGSQCRVLLPASGGSCLGPVPGGDGEPFQPRDVAWSPDGAAIVFSSRVGAAASAPEALTIMDVATGTRRALTQSLPGRHKEPTWQRSVDLRTNLTRPAGPGVVGAPVSFTLTVTNDGPAPSPDTRLTLAVPGGLRLTALTPARGQCLAAEARCELGLLEPGAVVQVTVELVGLVPGNQQVTWSVGGPVIDFNPSDNHAFIDLTFVPSPPPPVQPPPPPPPPVQPPPPPVRPPVPPAPPAPSLPEPRLAVSVQPNPSYVGGTATATYTVRNRGGQPAVGLRLALQPPAGVPVRAFPPGCDQASCFLGDLRPGGSAVVQLVLAPNKPLVTTVSGRISTAGPDSNPKDNVARARMRVLQPKIVAVPPIGSPGFVTSVRGTDFPPGTPVRLTWSAGITAAAAPAIPRADGTFAAQLLILGKDVLGPRTITASGAGFTPATTPFRVVAGAVGPPDFVARR
jgi:Tol biopolymer transport system component